MNLVPVATLSGHEDRVWSLSWHPNGEVLASCGGDKSIRLWKRNQANTWNCIAILNDGHKRTIRSIAWSPSGRQIASASFDATVCIWEQVSESESSNEMEISNGKNSSNGTESSNGKRWEAVVNLEGHENEVKSVSWSSDGKFLSTCSRDKTVWIWEVMDNHDFECAAVITNHGQDVKRTVWSPKERICSSCSYDNTIRLYQEQDDDWIEFDLLNGHESTVWSLDFDASGDRLVSVSDDKSIKIWQREGRKLKNVSTLSGYHSRPVYDVSWSKVNGYIATGSGDNSICIFGPTSSDNSCDGINFDLVKSTNFDLVTSINFDLVKSTNFDLVTSINFDLVTRATSAHENDVNCIQWNPVHSNILASASDDATIKVWSLQQ